MTRIAALLAVLLAGCSGPGSDSIEITPVAMTEDAVGHYCQMTVLHHDGPKAQVHLAGNQHPIWFVQIRDALAFDRMPEQPEKVAAIFVNDMGAPGAAWKEPGVDNWIAAADAYYVIGSDKRGGMGASEFVPFASQAAAELFSLSHGGRVIPYSEISDEEVLAPEDVELVSETEFRDGGS